MKRFLGLISALFFSSLFAGLFGVSSVSAASPYDDLVSVTSSLEASYNYPEDVTLDITYNWHSQISEALQIRCNQASNNPGSSYCQALNDISTLTDGYWIVTKSKAVNDMYPYKLLFTTNKSGQECGFKYAPDMTSLECTSPQADIWNITGIGFDQGHPHFATDQGLAIWNQPHKSDTFYYGSPFVGKEEYIFISTFPIEYPEGYQGVIIPDSQSDSKEIISPEFDYTLQGKNIYLEHRQDLDKLPPEAWQEYTQDGYYLNADTYSISWSIRAKGTTDLIETEYLPAGSPVSFDVEDFGEYVISADYIFEACYSYGEGSSTPDYCFLAYPEDTEDYDYQSKEATLLVDGYFHQGSTSDMECMFGFCESPDMNCDLKDSALERGICNMNKSVNFGVINPSLIAFRNLFTSFLVPPSPSCHIPIQNVQLAGHTFPAMNYSSEACNRAVEIRSHFPLLPILLNFLLAMLIFRLVVGIINRLTDNTKHDLIEGVNNG